VRLSLGTVWNIGQRISVTGWCIAFLSVAAGVGLANAQAAVNTAQATLAVSTNNAGPRTRVTLTAHVAGNNTPEGVVNFRAGALDLGSAIVDAEGNASVETDILPAGSHQVVAVYEGSSGASLSNTEVVQAHVAAVAGFTVAASPTTLTTVAGGYLNSVVTVTPNNGFTGYVSLSCKGLPINTTCAFTPVAVQATCTGSTCTPVTSTMQIQTQAPSPITSQLNGNGDGLPKYAFVYPALFGLVGLGACKRRTLRNLALGLITFAGVLGMSSCAQRYKYLNHGPPGNPGSLLGTYTVTIESQSSTGSQTTVPPTAPTLTLTITKS
jgi:Bacterial Ig-like domain (group 3)